MQFNRVNNKEHQPSLVVCCCCICMCVRILCTLHLRLSLESFERELSALFEVPAQHPGSFSSPPFPLSTVYSV